MTLEIIKQPGNRPITIQLSKVSEPFWSALECGIFKTTNCNDCNKITFPPKAICPACLSENMEWKQLSGKGVLYSYTTVHAVPPIFQPLAPLRTAIIDLTEGVRIVTRILSADKDIHLDSPVELVVVQHDDGYLFAAKLK